MLDLYRETVAQDGTRKILWRLHDGALIESVVIRKKHPIHLTACLSSQVGCAMGCKFCLTGKSGLTRNLTAEEIVAQVQALKARFPITHLVFMGMGEPLHNCDALIPALKILRDPRGMNFSSRKITVSTSGLVPAIDRLGREVKVALAVSLNAPTNPLRDQLMPINKKWNLESLFECIDRFPATKSSPVMLEYVLLKGVNDSLVHADLLFEWVKSRPVRVNLIPLNPHPGSEFSRPDAAQVKAFQHALVSRGVTATVRISRGDDILAACGQLAGAFL